MLVLFETPAGHALFKLLDDSSLGKPNQDFESPDSIKGLVQLKAFNKFQDTTAALAAATALVESKPSKDLRKFLKKQVSESEEIAVGDAKLGAAIKEKTGLQCIYSSGVTDLMRGIRSNLEMLLDNGDDTVGENSRKAMVLGLAHSLSRYKLKFSPDKVDTMIVQAIGLLDELDKEINTYAMRLREWYGWHFPELGKIIVENLPYAKSVHKLGVRTNAPSTDLSDILPEETEDELKAAAQISMGTEISDEDVVNIRLLCDQVVSLSDYRATLYEYLKNRMTAIAPNLTAMVGELVGARLIAHAGSLISLAKYPASTVQILGAEKALFRALKTKHATPKYGLIFHASLVGQATPKHKGKISRSLASKCALSIRVDALGDTDEGVTVGEKGREAVEARLRRLEGKTEFAISKQSFANKQSKYTPTSTSGKAYNTATDMTMPDKPSQKVEDVESKVIDTNGNGHSKKESEEDEEMDEAEKKRLRKLRKKEKKEKKRKEQEKTNEENGDTEMKAVSDAEEAAATPKAKSEEKEVEEDGEIDEAEKKRLKKERKKEKKRKRESMASAASTPGLGSEKKSKKKR